MKPEKENTDNHRTREEFSLYTASNEEVIASERNYLLRRREVNNLPHDDKALSEPWGICFSGGGIRSATLSLGVMQAMIRNGVFRHFDYMSTVSGGGYMGTCLSSLLSEPDPADFTNPEDPDSPRTYTANGTIPGVNPEDSPLCGLMPENSGHNSSGFVITPAANSALDLSPQHTPEAYPEQPPLSIAREARLDVRHQMHHLRTHGEYLTPEKGLFTRDVKRAIGAVTGGIIHNFFLFLLGLTFLASLHYFLFDLIAGGNFEQTIYYSSASWGSDDSVWGYIGSVVSNWWHSGFLFQTGQIAAGLGEYWGVTLVFLLMGLLLPLPFIFIWVKKVAMKFDTRFDILNNETEKLNSGETYEHFREAQVLRRFRLATVCLGPALGLLSGILMKMNGESAWAVYALPFVFAIGVLITPTICIPFLINSPKKRRAGSPDRVNLSVLSGMQGVALYSLITNLLLPLIILFLFSTRLGYNFFFALLAAGMGYMFMKRSSTSSKKSDDPGFFSRLMSRLLYPAINLSVLLFTGLAFSSISALLMQVSGSLDWYLLRGPEDPGPGFTLENLGFNLVPLMAALVSGGLFLFLGYTVNSNRFSLHSFYRDRLAEAFMRTDARVLRQEEDWQKKKQGNPLATVRNDEAMLLKDLGENNFRGPYHIIVAALNLQGSNELVRKTQRSDHFFFTRNYVGSRPTGYVRTDIYTEGNFRLASAMTISAAAVHSGMGGSSFLAQSFLTTLFNLRLGYWIRNPWFYRGLATVPADERRGNRMQEVTGKVHKETRRNIFWPAFLLREMMGRSTAKRMRINVSDGGHTGDNLGLLPLLHRRCKVIVICDFEEDGGFLFQSFNNAVRMAYIEKDIKTDIDLRGIMTREKTGAGNEMMSRESIAVGTVTYPGDTKPSAHLVYIKSSLSGKLPVQVYHYYRENLDFPHQSTGDQYFDDAQFEAYRALGYHLGELALRKHFLTGNGTPQQEVIFNEHGYV